MNNYLPTNLRFIRKSYKLNQDTIANKFGVTRSGWSRWESGEREPQMKDIFAICDYFGLDPKDLLFTDLSAQMETKPMLTDEELELLQTFRRMPENQRNAILDMMRSMV